MVASLSCSELGTAQPQLVYSSLDFCRSCQGSILSCSSWASHHIWLKRSHLEKYQPDFWTNIDPDFRLLAKQTSCYRLDWTFLSTLEHSNNGPLLFRLVRDTQITHSHSVLFFILSPGLVSRAVWHHDNQEQHDGAERSKCGNSQKDLNSKQWLHARGWILLRILKVGHTHHFYSSFTPDLKLHSFSC